MNKTARLRPLDTVIIGVVLAASLTGFLITSRGETGGFAVIYDNGEQVYKVSLDTEERTFEVGGAVIEVGGGKARFISSDCPDKTCVNTGALTKAGQSAVCVPNRAAVIITGGSGVDAVA